MTKTPHDFMSYALQLAERGRFTVSPNPMVGCVIVKNDSIVGQGFHHQPGLAHAEIHALEDAGEAAKGASMFVTLEPCCHYNRTPPCVSALIESGITKIYVACLDPNPQVAGKGIAALKAADIQVEVGLCEQEARTLNHVFFHYITYKRPFVIAKWAMSLDGKTITHPEDNKNISCAASRKTTHYTRQCVDAVLVGAKTAIDDDPLLTVRLGTNDLTSHKQPQRIILSTHGKLPTHLKMFKKNMPAKTLIATTQPITEFDEMLIDANVEIMQLNKNANQQVDISHLLDELGKREISSLLVEGGMTVLESFFQENLINEFHVYVAPVIIGSLEKKQSLTNLHIQQIDRDYFFTANLSGEKYV